MRRRVIAALLLAVLTIASPAFGQRVTGDIEGTVRDEAGAPLPDVSIVVRNRATGFERVTTTDPTGRFIVPNLSVVGEYDLRAGRSGFAATVREAVAVHAGRAVPVDFVLKVAVAETVIVSVDAPALDRQQSTGRQDVSETLIRALPLFRRDFVQLTALAAGFTGNPDFPSPQGQIYWTHNVLVDGASHFSKWRSAPRAFYSGYGIESIKEVQVLTNLFSAEYGEALASVTSVVTKAGTNAWHGSALLFVHDDAFDGAPVFGVARAVGGSQQYGVSLGGPVVKDRTHILASYEGHRSRSRNVVTSPAAPNALVPDEQDEHLLFVRVDHQRSARHVVTARYNGQLFDWRREPGGLVLPGSGTRYRNDVHTALVTDGIVAADRTFNELRLQAARYIDVRDDLSPSVSVSRAGYSVEGGSLGPTGFGASPEDTWEASDLLSHWAGSHTIKVGGGGRYVRAHTRSLSQGHGAYYFAGPPDLFPEPFLFVQGLARSAHATTADPRSRSAFVFAQDDWRVRPRLTLNLGVRYDVEGVSNVGGYSARVDTNNVQPRAAVVWDPAGGGRTIVRGGAGIYTQQHLLYPISRVQLEGPDGVLMVALTPDSPLMPVFPSALPALAPGVLPPPRDVHRVEPDFRSPYAIQSMVGVQQLLSDVVLTVDYVRLAGHDLMSLVDANAPASNVKPAQRAVAAADATRPLVPTAGTFRNVITLGNLGRSWYRALQIKADRSTGAWQTLASYTLSRAEDMANYQLPEDSRNLSAEKGPALADLTHNLTVGFTWALPDGAVRIWNGWTVSALGRFRSGRPYTIAWGDDRNGTAQLDARPGGRNTARTGAYRSVDVALAKRFRRGRTSTEARLEAFNVFNATNYDQYVGQLLAPLFARPVSAFPQRRLQLAAILRF